MMMPRLDSLPRPRYGRTHAPCCAPQHPNHQPGGGGGAHNAGIARGTAVQKAPTPAPYVQPYRGVTAVAHDGGLTAANLVGRHPSTSSTLHGGESTTSDAQVLAAARLAAIPLMAAAHQQRMVPASQLAGGTSYSTYNTLPMRQVSGVSGLPAPSSYGGDPAAALPATQMMTLLQLQMQSTQQQLLQLQQVWHGTCMQPHAPSPS